MTKVLRRLLYAAGVLVGLPVALTALLVMINQVIAPFTTRSVLPTFEFHEADVVAGADPDALYIIFHGLWSSDWGRKQLAYYRRRGSVLVVINGKVDLTPTATLAEMGRLDLLGHTLYVVGFSMGTITAVEFLRLYQQATGRDVPYAKLVCGPAAPDYVIWPWEGVPIVLRLVAGGPILQFAWRRYLAAIIARDVEAGARVHAASVVSGVRKLSRGAGLQPAEFAGTQTLFIEHTTDHRVRSCYDAWHGAFPNSRLWVINGPGHGDFENYPTDYQAAYDSWPVERASAA